MCRSVSSDGSTCGVRSGGSSARAAGDAATARASAITGASSSAWTALRMRGCLPRRVRRCNARKLPGGRVRPNVTDLVMRRSALVLIAVLAGAAVARADVGGAVAIGGGVRAGADVAAIDARADWASAGGGAAIGIGARVRAIGGAFARADWDDAADWLAIVRYVELRRAAPDGDRADVVAGAMRAVTLGDGALVDGVAPAAILDRRATSVRARARVGRASFDAVIDDVTRPAVIGARGAYAPGDGGDGGAELAVEAALDPAAPSMTGTRPFGAIAIAAAAPTHHREVTDRVELGATAQAAAGAPGAGAWLAATTAAALGDARFALRGEVTLGTSHDVAAPFGPLYLIERDAQLDRARAG